MGQSDWYAVEVKPHSERRVEQNLARQGFVSFCPRFRKLRSHARRKDIVIAPLFPGYLFVQFDRSSDAWRSVNGTFGVKRLVAADPVRPRPMPQSVIDLLVARCEPGTNCLTDGPLSTGAKVRFATGPLFDRIATVEQLDPGGRVRLLLDILGAKHHVVVAREDVVLA